MRSLVCLQGKASMRGLQHAGNDCRRRLADPSCSMAAKDGIKLLSAAAQAVADGYCSHHSVGRRTQSGADVLVLGAQEGVGVQLLLQGARNRGLALQSFSTNFVSTDDQHR